MPWEECTVMDQKLKFIARLLKGEQMAPLCREFDITRPTVTKSGVDNVKRRKKNLDFSMTKAGKATPVQAVQTASSRE